VKEKIDGGKS